jgi:hypothetical protein
MDYQSGRYYMLRIEWMEGYHNLPNIVLEEALDLEPLEESEFTFKDGLWYHIQANGLVQYFAHTGEDVNQGGFGGRLFTILHNGEPKVLKGPWSSRAACVDRVQDQRVMDIRLDNGKGYPRYCGILVDEVIKRWDQPAFLLRRKVTKPDVMFGLEQGPFTASLANDCILKPSGMRIDEGEYEVFAEPVESDQ